MIELKGITKTYKKNGSLEVNVLQGIDLEIGKGEFVAIMAPSGMGKSTLMNIIGCLDRPSGGQYFLDGKEE
jgi:ABC-type lipoprotein export system ATPase subunit